MSKTSEKVSCMLQDAGLSHTHWGCTIIAACERGGFNDTEMQEAQNWPTCACGRSKHKYKPGLCGDAGEPADDELFQLGYDFDWAVRRDRFDYAAKLLIQIEARTALLTPQIVDESCPSCGIPVKGGGECSTCRTSNEQLDH